MIIYRIYNTLNGKSYIGQTIKAPEERWKEHLAHCRGSHFNDQSKVLYKAMRKYGPENFCFEVLQDDISSYEELDKAEIYWIDHYDSFLHGYNATRGGQKYHSYFPCDEIIKDYHLTRSARKTAKKFGLDHSTVDHILNANNVKRYSFRQSAGKRLVIRKESFSKEFDSARDCAQWLLENNYCETSFKTLCVGINKASRENREYKGFYFHRIEG